MSIRPCTSRPARRTGRPPRCRRRPAAPDLLQRQSGEVLQELRPEHAVDAASPAGQVLGHRHSQIVDRTGGAYRARCLCVAKRSHHFVVGAVARFVEEAANHLAQPVPVGPADGAGRGTSGWPRAAPRRSGGRRRAGAPHPPPGRSPARDRSRRPAPRRPPAAPARRTRAGRRPPASRSAPPPAAGPTAGPAAGPGPRRVGARAAAGPGPPRPPRRRRPPWRAAGCRPGRASCGTARPGPRAASGRRGPGRPGRRRAGGRGPPHRARRRRRGSPRWPGRRRPPRRPGRDSHGPRGWVRTERDAGAAVAAQVQEGPGPGDAGTERAGSGRSSRSGRARRR